MADERDDESQPDVGGDPACWLDRVCESCGAFLERADEPCWRCGEPQD